MLIRLRNIALVLGLYFIPSIFSLDVSDLENYIDSSENKISCESNELCLFENTNDNSRPNDTEELSDDEESDSDSSQSLESALKLLSPLLQNNAGTKITFNVRDIQNGFRNYGAGYRVENTADEAARDKRQIDSTVQVPNNNVVQNNEQTFLNTSGIENHTTYTDGQVAIQNNTLPNINLLFNNGSIIHEPNSNTSLAKTAGTITENLELANVTKSNVNVVTLSEINKEEKTFGVNAVSANVSNNTNISQNKDSDENSVFTTTIDKIQRLLSSFLNNISSKLQPVYNYSLKNKSSNENSNTPLVVHYTCNCGMSEGHKHIDEDLDHTPNTRHRTFTDPYNSDGANSLHLPNIDISNKLAKLNAKGNKYISKKIDDANLNYWKHLLSILSNTSSLEFAVDNTNGLNTNTKPDLNNRQINKNILNSKLNESADNLTAQNMTSDNDTSKPLQNNNITSNTTEIDQGLTNIQTNVNNPAIIKNNTQDQNTQPGKNRKRRSIWRNLIHTSYQLKNNRMKRQVDGNLNEMIRNTYPFSHHAFHHLDRPFPHHAFHHLNGPIFPHHSFHHLNHPLYFSNHRKALRHLISTNYWLQNLGGDNRSTDDKPSGYNHKEVVENHEIGESRKVADADMYQ